MSKARRYTLTMREARAEIDALDKKLEAIRPRFVIQGKPVATVNPEGRLVIHTFTPGGVLEITSTDALRLATWVADVFEEHDEQPET